MTEYAKDLPQLDENQAKEFCSMLAMKYSVAGQVSPHIGRLNAYESIYGDNTLDWIKDFFKEISSELYLVDSPGNVFRCLDGSDVNLYLWRRQWHGYEYFVADPNAEFLVGIFHEINVYGCGRAAQWLAERKQKLWHLLGLRIDVKPLVSEIVFSEWGRNTSLIVEAQVGNDMQHHQVTFQNCRRINWNPPWKDTAQKSKIRQSFFGRHLGSTDFFALRGDLFDIQFDYEKVIVERIMN